MGWSPVHLALLSIICILGQGYPVIYLVSYVPSPVLWAGRVHPSIVSASYSDA